MKASSLLGFLLFVAIFNGCNQPNTSIDPVATVLKLDVLASDQIRLAGEVVRLDDLQQELQGHIEQAPVYVVLNLDAHMPMDIYHEVMKQVRDTDIAGLSISPTDTSLEEAVAVNFYQPVLDS